MVSKRDVITGVVVGSSSTSAGATPASGLSIKGSAAANNSVEVEGLAPGTTAEDVAEIFSRCGTVVDKRLLSDGSAPSAHVYIRFQTAQAAQTAVSQFDGQSADGRQLKVFMVSAGSLGSRLGLDARKNPTKEVRDVLGGPSSSSGMRSDEIIMNDPRAKVIVDPSGINEMLRPTPAPPSTRGTGRGRGRGGIRGSGARARGAKSLSARMELD